jgi:hypothetical protein
LISEFESLINIASKEFVKKVLNEFIEKEYKIPISPFDFKKVIVNKNQIMNSITTLISKNGNGQLIQDIRKHVDILEALLPFCSSPKSFSFAWKIRSEILTKELANRLVNDGAQLIPINENEKLFKIEQQGVQLGPNQD